VEGGWGWWVQISTHIHFNTPFRLCFTITTIKREEDKVTSLYMYKDKEKKKKTRKEGKK
jgi:hypothetical protein